MRRTAFLWAPMSLTPSAVTQALTSLSGWKPIVDSSSSSVPAIERNYQFPNFLEAIKFMNVIAPICEDMQHHPKWTNVYNRLHVQLTTHDAGNQVTQKDVGLAQAMSKTYEDMYGKSTCFCE